MFDSFPINYPSIENCKICIVGLGYVGLPLAIEFSKIKKSIATGKDLNREVIGFDLNQKRIKELESGIDSTKETDLEDLKEFNKIKFTSDIKLIRESDVYIISVPTPIDENKKPDLSCLIKASESIGETLKNRKSKYKPIIIYESTVFPGATEEICVPILEKKSSLKFNEDFFCGYSPERINPGDKVNTLTKIKKITSGSTPEIANKVDALYATIISAGTFKASSIKVAEAAKVIENTQRDLNIAFVNELSIIFNLLDIDTLDVLEAAGSKWNSLLFRPGLVGGHCIGVDPYYLAHKAEQAGYSSQIILSGRRINDGMAHYTVKKVVQQMLKNGLDVSLSTVGVMGVTFKENCPDIRNSKVIDIINELKNWNIKVVVVDPWADPREVEVAYGISLGQINSMSKVDSLIVAVGHKEFRELKPWELRSYCNGNTPVLADVKSLFDRNALADQGFSVFRL